ncbi:sporulation peptidase YabG [Paenibacillus sp. MWE-103]|uniref:Sporulation peptidase YabG n=1 Tax=Paenibacillus artemisiicola TaxID=1172618 RepID=A0ABS3WIA9_9BACL|nr:sporulation peptidase YabG [Paenibacillus artemisiicola]MBO7748066.1 sporulation peptidase YabG [Paenibacillus artemisiicola]
MMQGDLVVRKSYGGDVLFRVAIIEEHTAVLKGTDYRLLADAPLNDLSVVKDGDGDLPVAIRQARLLAGESTQRMQEERQQQIIQRELLRAQNQSQPYFDVPGKVLHLDGDGNYMKKSMQLYTQMRVPAHGLYVHESQMADAVYRLLPQIKPDIVVITGHDGVLRNREQNDLNNLASYKNSQNFVDAVRVARDYEKSRDGLVVVAGACQSHYEALLQSGSNFASSPGRVLIHALDPVYVAIKASYTPISETINLPDVIHGTISGIDGVGGVETFGKYRVGLPKPRTLTGVKATV